MYLVYIDESGSYNDGSYVTDSRNWQPANMRESEYFVLTGLVVHQNVWKTLFKKLKNIRENVKRTHNVPLAEYVIASVRQ